MLSWRLRLLILCLILGLFTIRDTLGKSTGKSPGGLPNAISKIGFSKIFNKNVIFQLKNKSDFVSVFSQPLDEAKLSKIGTAISEALVKEFGISDLFLVTAYITNGLTKVGPGGDPEKYAKALVDPVSQIFVGYKILNWINIFKTADKTVEDILKAICDFIPQTTIEETVSTTALPSQTTTFGTTASYNENPVTTVNGEAKFTTPEMRFSSETTAQTSTTANKDTSKADERTTTDLQPPSSTDIGEASITTEHSNLKNDEKAKSTTLELNPTTLSEVNPTTCSEPNPTTPMATSSATPTKADESKLKTTPEAKSTEPTSSKPTPGGSFKPKLSVAGKPKASMRSPVLPANVQPLDSKKRNLSASNANAPNKTDEKPNSATNVITIDIAELINIFKKDLSQRLRKDSNFRTVFSDNMLPSTLNILSSAIAHFLAKAFKLPRTAVLPLENDIIKLVGNDISDPELYAEKISTDLGFILKAAKILSPCVVKIQASMAAKAISSAIENFLSTSPPSGVGLCTNGNAYSSHFSVLNGLDMLPYVGPNAVSQKFSPVMKAAKAFQQSTRFSKALFLNLISCGKFNEQFLLGVPKSSYKLIANTLGSFMAEAFGSCSPSHFAEAYSKALLSYPELLSYKTYAKVISMATSKVLYSLGFFLSGSEVVQAATAANAVLKAIGPRIQRASARMDYAKAMNVPWGTPIIGARPVYLSASAGRVRREKGGRSVKANSKRALKNKNRPSKHNFKKEKNKRKKRDISEKHSHEIQTYIPVEEKGADFNEDIFDTFFSNFDDDVDFNPPSDNDVLNFDDLDDMDDIYDIGDDEEKLNINHKDGNSGKNRDAFNVNFVDRTGMRRRSKSGAGTEAKAAVGKSNIGNYPGVRSILDILPKLLSNKLYSSTALFTSLSLVGIRKVVDLFSQAIAAHFGFEPAAYFLDAYNRNLGEKVDSSFRDRGGTEAGMESLIGAGNLALNINEINGVQGNSGGSNGEQKCGDNESRTETFFCPTIKINTKMRKGRDELKIPLATGGDQKISLKTGGRNGALFGGGIFLSDSRGTDWRNGPVFDGGIDFSDSSGTGGRNGPVFDGGIDFSDSSGAGEGNGEVFDGGIDFNDSSGAGEGNGDVLGGGMDFSDSIGSGEGNGDVFDGRIDFSDSSGADVGVTSAEELADDTGEELDDLSLSSEESSSSEEKADSDESDDNLEDVVGNVGEDAINDNEQVEDVEEKGNEIGSDEEYFEEYANYEELNEKFDYFSKGRSGFVPNNIDSDFELYIPSLAKALTEALRVAGILNTNFSLLTADQLAVALVAKLSSLIATSLEVKSLNKNLDLAYNFNAEVVNPPLNYGWTPKSNLIVANKRRRPDNNALNKDYRMYDLSNQNLQYDYAWDRDVLL